MKRIVVIRAGALGDTVLTFPALSLLRRSCPDAEVTAIGHPALWETAGDLIDRAIAVDEPQLAGLFTGELKEPGALLEGVDLVIAWTVRDPSEALRRAGVSEVIHVSPYPPPGIHAAQWLVQSVEAVVPPTPNPSPSRVEGSVEPRTSLVRSPLSPLEGERGRGIGGKLILIHPGAGSVWKRWPAERFAQLGERLREEGLPVTLVEGPADEEAVAAVQGAARTPFPVLRGLSPAELAGELKRGELFVGNDSGVTHLAAWSGLPTIALFGPTDPISWAPMGDVRVLRVCVTGATKQGEIRVCDDPRCMEDLPLDTVLEAALDVVRRHGASGEPCR